MNRIMRILSRKLALKPAAFSRLAILLVLGISIGLSASMLHIEDSSAADETHHHMSHDNRGEHDRHADADANCCHSAAVGCSGYSLFKVADSSIRQRPQKNYAETFFDCYFGNSIRPEHRPPKLPI